MEKYSDLFMQTLNKLDFTHCFYVSGGNIMHALESANKFFTCVPFVHEVSAGIAAEYFNEANLNSKAKAFVLVTAGPGLTNLTTSIAGAFLESRELLVVGGQVKSQDLKNTSIRQRGIQEIDGLRLVDSIVKKAMTIKEPVAEAEIIEIVQESSAGRPGPVFIEFCLDAQGAPILAETYKSNVRQHASGKDLNLNLLIFAKMIDSLKSAERPVLLLGGGVSRTTAERLELDLANLGIPVMTTWNGTDRVSSSAKNYFGRPNTWGQRYANVILQQADFLIAVGTRVGLQQTGFNFKEFLKSGTLAMVDIDSEELNRPDLQVTFKFNSDANIFLDSFCKNLDVSPDKYGEWISFCNEVKSLLPVSEDSNSRHQGFLNPYDFYLELSSILTEEDSVVPSSSGATETVAMQALMQIRGNHVITNKSLASMGYGLAGAIGVALKTNNRVFLIEGDGGFAQNLQELGTVAQQRLPIKIFIFSNEGYASIRATQRNYFNGNYIGCDIQSGLGLPDWSKLFGAYGLDLAVLGPDWYNDELISQRLESDQPEAFLVPIHPEQTYYPKITSKILPSGEMASNPLHLMTPDLAPNKANLVFRFLEIGEKSE